MNDESMIRWMINDNDGCDMNDSMNNDMQWWMNEINDEWMIMNKWWIWWWMMDDINDWMNDEWYMMKMMMNKWWMMIINDDK